MSKNLMKLMSFLVLGFVVSSSVALAGSLKPPSYGTKEWYFDRPYTACAQYGHPWVLTKPFDKEKWDACAAPYYAYATQCYEKVTVGGVFKRWKLIENCQTPKPE